MAYVAILAIASCIRWDRTGERWGYTAMAALSALLLLQFSRGYSELRSPLQTPVGGMFLACVSGIVVVLAWSNLDAPLLRFSDQEGVEPISKSGRMEWEWALVRIGGSVLLVPLIEELFWRSFLLRWLEKPNFLAVGPSGVSHRSILLSSAAFALEHTDSNIRT